MKVVLALVLAVVVVVVTLWLDTKFFDKDNDPHTKSIVTCPTPSPSVGIENRRTQLSVKQPGIAVAGSTPAQRTNSTPKPPAIERENPHAKSDGDDHGKGKGDTK